MIKRIVKLTFHEDKVADFLAVFEKSKAYISNFEGCHHLELWRSNQETNVFFTYSYWENEAALNAYRYSDLFQTTWAKTKVLFADKPQAWSVEVVEQVKLFQ